MLSNINFYVIKSITTFNRVGFLFFQDATQGNIRFNRAGNQHSMSYASNGELNQSTDIKNILRTSIFVAPAYLSGPIKKQFFQ